MAALPKHTIRVACVAAAIAVLQAVSVIITVSVLLAQHSSCVDANVTVAPSQLFTHQLKVHYFQDANCEYNGVLQDGIMDAGEVYVWLVITLSFSIAWLIASICLFVVSDERATEYFGLVAYAWSASTAAVVVVDFAMAIHLGLDFAALHRRLGEFELVDSASYAVDSLRLGSLLLMTLALKGYVLAAANAVHAVLLVLAGSTARRRHLGPNYKASGAHSVHTRGPLNAFTTHQRTSDPWLRQGPLDAPFERGTNTNRAFVDSEDMGSLRDASNDYTNSRLFDRSNSWHHSRGGPQGSEPRPFSYLEEQRGRADPAPSPAAVPPWRRDPWDLPPPQPPLPPLPAPDYSPLAGRRLKSVLKQTM